MDETRSSIHVAPLKITKSSVDLTKIAQPVQSPTHSADSYESQVQMKSYFTPPPTPYSSQQPTTEQGQPQSTFHNFLRAFYPFHPSDSLSPSTVTLPLNAGDIVFVHSVHTNGWADGTLLETGDRGWLPTNYCEAYEFIPMRPLLKALTEFWDAIRCGSRTSSEVFNNQDYMRGLIAGVRYLLERSGCLTRDAETVKRHDNVRRTRKALLSDLSGLVKVAKRLQDLMFVGAPAGDEIDDICDDMLLKAFKIVTRGVRFLDVYNEDTALDRAVEGVRSIINKVSRQQPIVGVLTPPLDSTHEGTFSSNPLIPQVSCKSHRKTLSAKSFSQPIQRPLASWGSSFPRSDNPQKTPRASRPASMHSKRVSLSQRLSYPKQNLASEKLATAHDAFLSGLGIFMGLHMDSRSSSELLLTTQQSVKACRDLLTMIDVVLDHDEHRSQLLADAKDITTDAITELVEAAREVFRPENTPEDDWVFMPDHGKRIADAATSCVKGAGECVFRARMVLEVIGDFEIEPAEKQACPTSISSVEQHTEPSKGEATPLCPGIDPITHQRQESATTLRPIAPRLEIPYTTISPPSPVGSSFTLSLSQSGSELISPGTPATMSEDIPSPVSESSNQTGSTIISPVAPPPPPPQIDTSIQEKYEEPFLRRQKSSSSRHIVKSTGSSNTYVSSARDSEFSRNSETSSRATSPDPSVASEQFSEGRTTLADDCDEAEAKIMERSFAHELMYNKEGQIIGGSLAALIEKLTAHDSTPDALFVSTFYLTFRLFASPTEFAEALAHRFDYIGETAHAASPVRLRVYNVFKGWLESHWRHDCDDIALPFILDFARHHLMAVLPALGKKLTELAEKVGDVHGPLVPRLVSSIGKTNTSIAQYINPDAPLPPPMITKGQLAALRTWKNGGGSVSIMDFEPLELARQITLKESSIFSSILPEELLATEWMKRSGSLAVNVRTMSTLSTDLANLVADSVLQLEEPKKRAALIKHWVKIANKCLELNNYDTLMAIICSLSSSTISRLKKTWEIVSSKTKAVLEELKKIVDVSLNYKVLRQRLQNHVPPCLPYVGMYLTDLTFVDHGNQTTRQLPNEEGSTSVINFDKHVKTAKIISELQRFQIPYRLTEVPELQTWMQDQLVRVRSSGEKSFQTYYRRSLVLEPREAQKPLQPNGSTAQSFKPVDKFDFLTHWTLNGKSEKNITSH